MTLQRLPHTGNTPLYQHHTRLFIALTTQDTSRLLKKRLPAAARGVGRLEAASGFVIAAS